MIQKMKVILQWGIVVMGLILAFSLVRSLNKILGSSEKITQAQNDLASLQKENIELNETLNDVTSVEFIEGQARDKLGLAKKGEIVVVLPDEDKLRRMAPKIEEREQSLPDPIWKQWLKLFI